MSSWVAREPGGAGKEAAPWPLAAVEDLLGGMRSPTAGKVACQEDGMWGRADTWSCPDLSQRE